MKAMLRHIRLSWMGCAVLAFFPFFSAFAAGTADDYYRLGLESYERKEYAQSILYLKTAIQADPTHWKAYQVLGYGYYMTSDLSNALTAFDTSLLMHPDNPGLSSLAERVRVRLAPPAARMPDSVPEEKRARELLEQGQRTQAIRLLKEAIGKQSEAAPSLLLLLAQAYLQDGNDFWALRTLATLAGNHPGDCESRLLMAWIHIRQGALEPAREALDSATCPAGSPFETRAQLLRAMVKRHAGETAAARENLSKARGASQAFPEDRQALKQLSQSLDPGRLSPFAGRLQINGGCTSNALAGSPTDSLASGKDAFSPAGQLNASLKLVYPTDETRRGFFTWVRPFLEGNTTAAGYTSDAGRDLSYTVLGVRPGLLVGDGFPHGLLAYRYEAALLAGGDRYEDGPLWFYAAHRGEFEAEILPQLSLFGGAGRRIFREIGRSRLEVDGGLSGGLRPARPIRLSGALTARLHIADKAPYDLWGGSLLLAADVRLPARWSLRASAITSIDDYPRSAGYFDASLSQTSRRDSTLKLSAVVFIPPPAENLKLGLAYEYATRFSTTDPYDYQDHRVLAKLSWNFSVEARLPGAVALPGHVTIDYGLSESGTEERIQDLLRQEESVQRGSTCLD